MKQMNQSWVVIITGLLLIGGCASTQTEKTPENLTSEDRIRTYNKEFYRTFNIITKVLKNEGFSVETADSQNGLIYTDYQLASTLNAPISGNSQLRVEAVLKKRDQETEVTLTIRAQQEIALTGSSRGISEAQAKLYYQMLFDRIGGSLRSP